MIRLLDLPPEVKDLVVEGGSRPGMRALLAVPDPVSVAHRIVETSLSVRDVEAIAQTDPGSGSDPEAPADGREGCGHPRGRTGARGRARACGHDPPPGQSGRCGSATRPWTSSMGCAAGCAT